MPVHDWTRVDTGIFHHFHTASITELARGLNAGLLPSGHDALTLAEAPKVGYVEMAAVGDVLPVMPLFLTPEQYISVPLEPTYLAAYAGMPRFYRDILERPGDPG